MSITDGRRIDHGSRLECDVCIVGAGAAGITLALELAKSSLSVILLESGGHKPDAATQDLYDGDVADPRVHSPPRHYRRRQFGGTTTIWGGGCIPYDPLDFERRDHVPHSGWPFGRDELDRWYPRANRLLEAGDFAYHAADALPGEPRTMIPGFTSARVRDDLLERNSPPTDFARRYGALLRNAPRVRVLLHSNCTHLGANADGRAVDHVDVATLSGNRFTVAARRFVLATGGLEVPRLLLASRDVHPEGIGNGADLVGRYYMRHLSGPVGRLELPTSTGRLRYGIRTSPDGVHCRRLLALTPDEQRRQGVANLILRLWSHVPDPSHRSGGLSTLYLLSRLLPYEHKKWTRGVPEERLVARHLRNVAADPLGALAFARRVVFGRMLTRRNHPTMMTEPGAGWYALNFVSEQVPNDASRVRLTDRRDALGMPRIHVDWRYTDLDVETVKRSCRVVAEEFARSGAGRFTFSDEEVDETIRWNGAYDAHHIGTTRMSDSPSRGVVDRDCRVHGVDNLFICSASVFPTGSHALPTLTIVALAVRLAAYLEAADARVPAAAYAGVAGG